MGGLVSYIMYSITSSLIPGSYNPILSFSFNLVGSIIVGIIFGIIVFLLVTRAEMNRTITKYVIVSLAFQGVLFLLDVISVAGEFDLLVDGPIKLVVQLADVIVYALVYFYLEQQFAS